MTGQRVIAHLEPEAKANVERIEIKVREPRMAVLVPSMVPVHGCSTGCTPDHTSRGCALHTGYVNA